VVSKKAVNKGELGTETILRWWFRSIKFQKRRPTERQAGGETAQVDGGGI
jgi:hypothetical protein